MCSFSPKNEHRCIWIVHKVILVITSAVVRIKEEVFQQKQSCGVVCKVSFISLCKTIVEKKTYFAKQHVFILSVSCHSRALVVQTVGLFASHVNVTVSYTCF